MIENRLQIMRNTLCLNRGDDTFADIADYAGVDASDWAWSPVFIDVDLDGDEDLLISGGLARYVQAVDAAPQAAARQLSYKSIRDEVARQNAFTREKLAIARLYPRL